MCDILFIACHPSSFLYDTIMYQHMLFYICGQDKKKRTGLTLTLHQKAWLHGTALGRLGRGLWAGGNCEKCLPLQFGGGRGLSAYVVVHTYATHFTRHGFRLWREGSAVLLPTAGWVLLLVVADDD